MIQGLLILSYDSYQHKQWHGTMLLYAILAFSLFVNTFLARILPHIESVIFMVHVVGFFCILIPLVYFAPHGSVHDVFQTFTNSEGWSTDGLSFFIGLSGHMFTFIGKHLIPRVEVANCYRP